MATSEDDRETERSGADSYSENLLARSSSTVSTISDSRNRLGSKTSVASSSAGNRDSIISNEAAPGYGGQLEAMSENVCRSFMDDRLVSPIMEETDPSFSQPLPEFTSPLQREKDIDFLMKISNSQCEKVPIKYMAKILSEDRGRLINTPPFIARLHGCTLCLHVALDQKNVSIGIKLMKGDRDKQLAWPFNMIVVLRLENQSGGEDRVKMFRCEKNLHLKDSLLRPKTDMNLPVGYQYFIPRQQLQDGFVKNNAMLLKCYLFPKDAKINLCSEYPSIIR